MRAWFACLILLTGGSLQPLVLHASGDPQASLPSLISRSPYDPARLHLDTARMYAVAGDWERTFVVLSRAAIALPTDTDIKVSLARVSAFRDQHIAQRHAAVARGQQVVHELGQLVQSPALAMPATSQLDFDRGAAPRDAPEWLLVAGVLICIGGALGWRVLNR